MVIRQRIPAKAIKSVRSSPSNACGFHKLYRNRKQGAAFSGNPSYNRTHLTAACGGRRCVDCRITQKCIAGCSALKQTPSRFCSRRSRIQRRCISRRPTQTSGFWNQKNPRTKAGRRKNRFTAYHHETENGRRSGDYRCAFPFSVAAGFCFLAPPTGCTALPPQWRFERNRAKPGS